MATIGRVSILLPLLAILTGCALTPVPNQARSTATSMPPTTTPAATLTTVREMDGAVMLPVPAGAFPMGSSEAQVQAAVALCAAQGYPESDCGSWIGVESPQHSVTLDAFWIDQTEVSNAQYRKCVADDACPEPSCSDDPTLTGDDQPVVCVNWDNAAAYCAWAGAGLPTEAEWEKAARGMDGRIYPWGNAFDASKANYCDSSCAYDWRDTGANDRYAGTAPVGSYLAGASPYRAMDMAGNVWEWVSDWYDATYYSISPERNPTGPTSGELRVLRGGSWDNPLGALRAAYRLSSDPEIGLDGFGFRCAASVPPGR